MQDADDFDPARPWSIEYDVGCNDIAERTVTCPHAAALHFTQGKTAACRADGKGIVYRASLAPPINSIIPDTIQIPDRSRGKRN